MEIATEYDSPTRIAAGLSRPMINMLRNGFYTEGSATVIGSHRSPTRNALVRRGLVHHDNRWTALGREVARVIDPRVKTMGALHAEANEDPRQRAECYRARTCCASTLGDVHTRACGTIEARKQWAPAGSAHGKPECSEACRYRSTVAHLLDCPRGVLIKARGEATRKRNKQVEAWEQRRGLFAPTRYEAWRAVQADHAEALAAGARAGRYATRPVAVTSEEFERAIDVALDASTMRNSLYAALRALGMVVQP